MVELLLERGQVGDNGTAFLKGAQQPLRLAARSEAAKECGVVLGPWSCRRLFGMAVVRMLAFTRQNRGRLRLDHK